jgi:ribonuclease-3
MTDAQPTSEQTGAGTADPPRRLSPATDTAITSITHHRFRNTSFIEEAMTHSSAKSEQHPSNERMEFFGDAVLGLIVTEMLYHAFPEYPEGELTRLKSILVSRESLAEKAIELGLHHHVLIGKGVGGRESLPRSILSNIYEAVVAAIYLDGGYQPCKRFVVRCFERDMGELIGRVTARNYKSALQQLSQAYISSTPNYKVVNESGPDHEKVFEVVAEINGQRYGIGVGPSKKEAEQTAARVALKKLLSTLDLGGDDESLLMELPDEGAEDRDFFGAGLDEETLF